MARPQLARQLAVPSLGLWDGHVRLAGRGSALLPLFRELTAGTPTSPSSHEPWARDAGGEMREVTSSSSNPCGRDVAGHS